MKEMEKTTCVVLVFLLLYTGELSAKGHEKYYQLLEESKSRSLPEELRDDMHGVKMGIPYHGCDDAKTRLYVDYDGSPLNYTCFRSSFPVQQNIKADMHCDKIPEKFVPKHICMNTAISYNDSIPTYGNHRPLWPKYGEYLFVPVQRWVHNLEHGAIVLLYHPCVDPTELLKLKELVRGCIRRHIITPYELLTPDRPLALVAWGCRLLINTVDEDQVVSFIKKRALWGPEWSIERNGQYKMFLLHRAKVVEGSDIKDSNLCPFH